MPTTDEPICPTRPAHPKNKLADGGLAATWVWSSAQADQLLEASIQVASTGTLQDFQVHPGGL